MAAPQDILTAAQNIVTAINNATQTYLAVSGARIATNLTTTTVVSANAGRLVNVSVIVAGSATGMIYNANNGAVTTAPLYVIPDTTGVYEVNLPVTNGIVVIPGTGQTVTISYS